MCSWKTLIRTGNGRLSKCYTGCATFPWFSSTREEKSTKLLPEVCTRTYQPMSSHLGSVLTVREHKAFCFIKYRKKRIIFKKNIHSCPWYGVCIAGKCVGWCGEVLLILSSISGSELNKSNSKTMQDDSLEKNFNHHVLLLLSRFTQRDSSTLSWKCLFELIKCLQCCGMTRLCNHFSWNTLAQGFIAFQRVF